MVKAASCMVNTKQSAKMSDVSSLRDCWGKIDILTNPSPGKS